MKLYSVTDMTRAVQEMLVGKGFKVNRLSFQHGIVEAVQFDGVIEQRFKFKIAYDEERDPL
jgi:hypothetical protein